MHHTPRRTRTGYTMALRVSEVERSSNARRDTMKPTKKGKVLVYFGIPTKNVGVFWYTNQNCWYVLVYKPIMLVYFGVRVGFRRGLVMSDG